MTRDNLKNIRLTVANKAAELIAEEGITDYHFAKTKAAKFLGFSTKEKLPSNNEIDNALIAYKHWYHPRAKKNNVEVHENVCRI